MTTNLCQAALRLTPDDGDLAPAERAATRQLLSEAMAVLPPRMIERLDRDVQVRWSDRLNHDVYGSAGGRTLLLNRRLLPALTDGRAATQRTARPELTALDSILPSGLLELLINRGLADASVLDDPREALRLGYRFDSYRDRYQAMFAVLRERLGLPQTDVEAWLELSAEQRRPWIEKADLRASAALLLVEQAALRRHLLLAQEELKKRYLGGRERGDASLAKADEALQGILANSGYLSRPAELLDEQGYGLPQASEWQRLEQASSERQARLSQLSEALNEQVRLLLGQARQDELEAVETNLTQIGNHLRSLHKAAGGLQLP